VTRVTRFRDPPERDSRSLATAATGCFKCTSGVPTALKISDLMLLSVLG
jgi:hypothetical protein